LGKASRAAPIAARISAIVEAGTTPRISSVSAGLRTSTQSPPEPATRWPPMKL